jgi:hypothetical protein
MITGAGMQGRDPGQIGRLDHRALPLARHAGRLREPGVRLGDRPVLLGHQVSAVLVVFVFGAIFVRVVVVILVVVLY